MGCTPIRHHRTLHGPSRISTARPLHLRSSYMMNSMTELLQARDESNASVIGDIVRIRKSRCVVYCVALAGSGRRGLPLRQESAPHESPALPVIRPKPDTSSATLTTRFRQLQQEVHVQKGSSYGHVSIGRSN